VLIRAAEAADRDAIWSILEPVFRAGDTYTQPRDITRDAALAYWHHDGHEVFVAEASRVLALDRAFCPRVGPGGAVDFEFDFAAERTAHHLGRMELPPAECFVPQPSTLRVRHPGAVGEVLLDPDGGSWMRGQIGA